jgi:hypothetical protein
VTNIQLLYILLDRVLLYYSHVIHWAHGRRDYPETLTNASAVESNKQGYTSEWSKQERQTCERFFRQLQGSYLPDRDQAENELTRLIREKLWKISGKEE